jgi:hypothetical protein
MTDYMERVSTSAVPFDYDAERAIFEKTFAVLNRAWGELSFGWWNEKAKTPVARFSAYHYEAFTLGLQAVLDRIDLANSTQMEQLKQAMLNIKADRAFIEATTGGGKNSRGALQGRVEAVREKLEAAI